MVIDTAGGSLSKRSIAPGMEPSAVTAGGMTFTIELCIVKMTLLEFKIYHLLALHVYSKCAWQQQFTFVVIFSGGTLIPSKDLLSNIRYSK